MSDPELTICASCNQKRSTACDIFKIGASVNKQTFNVLKKIFVCVKIQADVFEGHLVVTSRLPGCAGLQSTNGRFPNRPDHLGGLEGKARAGRDGKPSCSVAVRVVCVRHQGCLSCCCIIARIKVTDPGKRLQCPECYCRTSTRKDKSFQKSFPLRPWGSKVSRCGQRENARG